MVNLLIREGIKITWVITAIVASTVVSADAAYVSGKQKQVDIEMQADQEKIDAQSQELARREQLNKALAANAVSLATSGISGEGTPESISLSNARHASSSEALNSLSERLRASQRKRQASNAASQGGMAAASTLLKGATQVAQLRK